MRGRSGRGTRPPTSRLHTPSPTGYLQWHAWAEKKAKTHRQKRCPTCGLFAVWVPKKKRP